MKGDGAGAIILTPERAFASATDAANMQMRRNGRSRWNIDDYNRAVTVHAQLLKYLPEPYPEIADRLVSEIGR